MGIFTKLLTVWEEERQKKLAQQIQDQEDVCAK